MEPAAALSVDRVVQSLFGVAGFDKESGPSLLRAVRERSWESWGRCLRSCLACGKQAFDLFLPVVA